MTANGQTTIKRATGDGREKKLKRPTLRKSGNSVVLTLPRSFLEAADLHAGQHLDLQLLESGHLVLRAVREHDIIETPELLALCDEANRAVSSTHEAIEQSFATLPEVRTWPAVDRGALRDAEARELANGVGERLLGYLYGATAVGNAA